jgi:hypothetical protein
MSISDNKLGINNRYYFSGSILPTNCDAYKEEDDISVYTCFNNVMYLKKQRKSLKYSPLILSSAATVIPLIISGYNYQEYNNTNITTNALIGSISCFFVLYLLL